MYFRRWKNTIYKIAQWVPWITKKVCEIKTIIWAFGIRYNNHTTCSRESDRKDCFLCFFVGKNNYFIKRMRREKYAKNKVTGSRIYYFNGVRHGVRNDLLQHCTEHGRNEQRCIFKCISWTDHYGTACVYSWLFPLWITVQKTCISYRDTGRGQTDHADPCHFINHSLSDVSDNEPCSNTFI